MLSGLGLVGSRLGKCARTRRNYCLSRVFRNNLLNRFQSSFDALDGIIATESEARVREAVERLTPMQREVFLLRVNEGLGYGVIAAIVGSTEGAARVHYHNAMRAVKESLHD